MTTPKPRRNWGSPPKFGDNQDNYDMSLPASTIEMIRLRELRTSTMKVLKHMEDNGWLLPDSQAKVEMDAAWRLVMNEFSELYKEIQGDKEGNNLFGRKNPAYVINQIISTGEDKKNLILGDLFKVKIVDKQYCDQNGAIWEVVSLPPNQCVWNKDYGHSRIREQWRDNASRWFWKYLGNRYDSLPPYECPINLPPQP